MKHMRVGLVVLGLSVLVCTPVLAGEGGNWLSWESVVAAASQAAEEAGGEAKPAAPLPLLTFEGVSGGLITPMVYLCNADKNTTIGKPSVGYIYANLGSKNLHAVIINQTFLGRLELSYALNVLDLGSLPADFYKEAGLSIGRDSICLHHFNARALLLEENSFGLPLPAVTVGVHFKYNDGIADINRQSNHTLSSHDYDRQYGVDYTLTASKTFEKLACGRPLILTVGLRNSRAAQVGLLGFGGTCKTTVEASAACLVTDRLLVAYEFRQKNDPYTHVSKVLEHEKNWHAVSLTYVINDHLTVTGAWGCLGKIANSTADGAFLFQVKYEF